jgi:hypothetical protein
MIKWTFGHLMGPMLRVVVSSRHGPAGYSRRQRLLAMAEDSRRKGVSDD